MKKLLGTSLLGAIILIIPTTYAGEVTIPITDLKVSEKEKEFAVQLSVHEEELYAGAELCVNVTEGITIKKIDYEMNEEYMNVGPVQNSSGMYYFGYFDGENKFSGEALITMTLEKVDETIKEGSISVEGLNITRLDSQQNVQTKKQIMNEQVRVDFKESPIPVQETVVETVTQQEETSIEKVQTEEKTEGQTIDKSQEDVEVEPGHNLEIDKSNEDKPNSIEIDNKEQPKIIVEKEIVEVEAPLPYIKMSLGGLIIAIGAFFIGRKTKVKGILKEDKHDQVL